MNLAILILSLCLAAVAYAYGLYPLLLATLARTFSNPAQITPPNAPASDDTLPTATLLISAHNEETVINDRLQDALRLDYPAGRLHIVVVSDGSTDATATIVAGYASRGVKLLNVTPRGGKSSALNSAMQTIHTDLVILSDANTHFDRSAVRKLARWFACSTVTAVCGKLMLTDPATGKNVDGLYWKYETFLKQCESRLGGLLGANGAIYALRRDRFVPIPATTIVDDFVIPLLAKLHHGGRLVYDSQALASEETAVDMRAEFRRRARIGAGGFQAIALLWPLLNPRQGWLAFTFLSHKVLRWLCPFFMVGMLVTNLFLLQTPAFQYLLAAQLSFYLLSLLLTLIPWRNPLLRILRLAPMFTSMNLALLVGFFRWITGRQAAAWSRTARIAEVASPTA